MRRILTCGERAFVAGQLEPRDVRRLRAELVGGLADGAQRDVQLKRAWEAAPAFKPYGTTPSEHVWFWVQSGGIFGKSSRSDAVFKWYSTDARFKRERDFLKATR